MASSSVSASGLFFEKRAQVKGGRFFRDLEGRGEGRFFKRANPDPTFLWDEPVADGFHRPAREQPEAEEHGGERFHASDADAGTGAVQGVVARVADKPAAAGRAKQAAVELGQAYDKAKGAGAEALATGKDLGGKVLDRAARYGGQALDTLKGSGEGLGEGVDEALDSASRRPLGAAAMLGGAGILGARVVGGAARGAARGVKSLVHGKPKPPKGLIERGLAGLSHLFPK